MSKKPAKPETVIRPDPNRQHLPIDQDVQLPYQVRRAAALANALSTGQPMEAVPKSNRTRSEPRVALTYAEIDEALQHLHRGDLKVADPQYATIIKLAQEGGRQIKAHRQGAREKKTINSDSVTRRQEALIQAFRELSPKRQKYPTGTQTVFKLRDALIQNLGFRDDDDHVLSHATIKKDIIQLRPIIRLIQSGVIPRPGKPTNLANSEKTQQEMEAGRNAVAKAAAASKPHKSAR